MKHLFSFCVSVLAWCSNPSLPLVTAQNTAAAPIVEKVVLPPATANVLGSGDDETFTVQLTITGAGEETTIAGPASIVFSLDRSGSMEGERIREATNAIVKFINRLAPTTGAQAAIVSWAEFVVESLTSSALTNDFDALEALANNTSIFPNTNLTVGLARANDLLDTDNSTSFKAIIFLTDGGEPGNYTFAAQGGPANTSAANGYRIYAIGVGTMAATEPLEDMANATMGRFFPNSTSENLDAIFDDIFMEIVVSTFPSSVAVSEVTLGHIVVDCSSTTPTAQICNRDDSSGQTTIVWDDIGFLNDGESTLRPGEQVTLTFDAASTLSGNDVPVNDQAAEVIYADSDGAFATTPVNQAFVNILEKGNGNGKVKEGFGKGGKGGKKGGKRGKGGKGGKKGGRNKERHYYGKKKGNIYYSGNKGITPAWKGWGWNSQNRYNHQHGSQHPNWRRL